MEAKTLQFSAVAFQEEDGRWSAQCLEYDIAAQADDITDLQYEFERAIVAQVLLSHELGVEPFADIGAAPRRFWQMFENAKMKLPVEGVPFRLPHPAFVPHLSEMRVAKRIAQ